MTDNTVNDQGQGGEGVLNHCISDSVSLPLSLFDSCKVCGDAGCQQ